MNEQEKLAYCAGLFDGEGCISIARYRKVPSGHSHCQLQVIVVQKHPGGIDFFIKLFGGKRSPVSRHNRVNKYWRWMLSSEDASLFLQTLLPYLIEKKDQARLAIEFQSHRTSTKWARMANTGEVGRPGYDMELWKIRNDFADRLSLLKRAAAETK